ncbi:hypothetical protein TEA_019228 [Camellia sinensis var. sinensis]|uniref:PB1 domain-containing protein n=1 Tax=Camellia sinensis var. sinensis TaxID=542762 RepID=A0A4V6RXZ8_CAMSN|nr:hypothetical protein TEA_019228 [Camellia sinensis var. sinensis]
MAESDGRVAAYFPDDFKQYVDTQLNRCPVWRNSFYGWVFWSRKDDQSEHPPRPVKGVCGYRMISMDYKFYMDRESSDEQLGVPGRVFKHGFHEYSPNVEYYSIKEYPLRHHAFRCQVEQSWAIPLFDPSIHLCVGVLEVVSTTPSKEFLLYYSLLWPDFRFFFEEVGLESTISEADHPTDLNVRQIEALDEIDKVLKVVHEDHDLPLAQAWVPCEVDCTYRALVKGDIFHVIRNFMYRLGYCKFLAANRKSHLRKWQGVVGRAFSSPDVLFCKDVTQLSIIDYPLAHFARVEELGGCFAICLQSSCTGNDIYVLECFMPPSHKDYEELGEHLYIEEIPFQNGEKLDSVQMSQTTKSVPRLEPLQSGGEMTQLDLSNQQSMDALNNESNVVSAERSNIDVTCSQEKGKTKRPKRVHNKNGVKIEIPLDDILQNSKKSIQAAADNLKVSRSTLKRVCRSYGFPRWPPRKKNMVGQSQPSEFSRGVDHQQISQLSFDLPFNQASATVVHANPHNIAIEDANIVTMRAKYINNITIKFRLSLSPGQVELQQQIAKRLHLEAGSYNVKYKDEEDHVILIACDDDLQDCISTYRLLGTSIVVLIDPK